MSNHPSLSAALKRLHRLNDLSNPYKGDIHAFSADIELIATALQLVADCAEHTDSADACPVFTLKLPCSWLAADKGFLHALSRCRGREAGDE